MPEPRSERFHDAIVEQSALFAELISGADLTQRVPSCPDWDLARLVEHVGQAHRWAASLVARGSVDPPDAAPGLPGLPGDEAGRREWLPEGARLLTDAVREVGSDAPAWTFTEDRTADFWLRRMADETAVHRADAVLTLGGEFTLAPDLAADAITEWLGFACSPQAAAARPDVFEALRGNGETLHLHSTDDDLGVAGEWMIRRGPDGASAEHGHGKGDVAVRGPASMLLLALLGRIPSADPRIEVFGDDALFEHWVAHATF